jgi:hypothetical protein
VEGARDRRALRLVSPALVEVPARITETVQRGTQTEAGTSLMRGRSGAVVQPARQELCEAAVSRVVTGVWWPGAACPGVACPGVACPGVVCPGVACLGVVGCFVG